MKTQFLNTKKLLFAIFILVSFVMTAQAPKKMSYQAVIRTSDDKLVVSSPIGMKISILIGSEQGNSVYTEIHNVSTNANGLVSLEIGGGKPVSGDIAEINWAEAKYFIQIETDIKGGTNYQFTGVSQLLSVPYALYAQSAQMPPGNNEGDMQYWDGTKWVMIPVGTPGQYLQINASHIPTWTGGTYPKITTNPIANQTVRFVNYVYAGGTVVDDGNSVILEKGICWSTSPNPTIFTNKMASPYFNLQLGNLLPNTTYYVKAYVKSTAGLTYGNEVSFTTYNVQLPTLTTTAASGITGGVAYSGGNITDDGGADITERGICWSTSPNPTKADDYIANDGTTGSFTALANALLTNTTYHVRAYATNAKGTAYGNDITFTTTSTLSIGGYYQGGMLAYFLKPGDPGYSSTTPHGIIISKKIIGAAEFGCQNVTYPSNFSTEIGGGIINTANIVSVCNDATTAAVICDGLTQNGYSDWFLPSTGDWTAINANYTLFNFRANGLYLSSNLYYSAGSYINPIAYITGGSFTVPAGYINFYAFRMF